MIFNDLFNKALSQSITYYRKKSAPDIAAPQARADVTVFFIATSEFSDGLGVMGGMAHSKGLSYGICGKTLDKIFDAIVEDPENFKKFSRGLNEMHLSEH